MRLCSLVYMKLKSLAQSQSLEHRNVAIKDALTAVLKRVLALENSAQQTAVDTVLAHAPHYVREYQYALQESALTAEILALE